MLAPSHEGTNPKEFLPYNRGAMDYGAAIKALRIELEKLDRAIAQRESLTSPDESTSGALQTPKRRGRKSMGAEERRRVAERMKRYWAKQKK
jgi:hypothetical protein